MDKVANTANLARSLTTRMNRKKSVTEGSGMGSSSLARAFTTKKFDKMNPRPDISLPIELLSATNPLAFTAPDLPHVDSSNSVLPDFRKLTSFSSSGSLRSESSVPALSSAASTTLNSGLSTPSDELPDLHSRLVPSPEIEAKSPSSPSSIASSGPATPSSEVAAPAIPKRAPSHTKRTHQVLARQRSISRVRSESSAANSVVSTPALTSDSASRKSTSSSRHQSTHSSKEPTFDEAHPFGAELAQLSEIAEEFMPRRDRVEETPQSRAQSPELVGRSSSSKPSVPSTPRAPSRMRSTVVRKQKPIIEPTVWDEEQEYLTRHGLQTFSAEEYMAEIGSPYEGSFPGAIY